MPQSYTPEFKKEIVRLHEEEGRTYKSITAEYGVSKASIFKWCSELRKCSFLWMIEAKTFLQKSSAPGMGLSAERNAQPLGGV